MKVGDKVRVEYDGAGSGTGSVSFWFQEEAEPRFKVEDVQTSEVQYIDLTEADRIVSGGRSVKSKDSFDSLIRPLAQVLGATAGAVVGFDTLS